MLQNPITESAPLLPVATPEGLTTPEDNKHILETYIYPQLGYRVEVVAPDDYRVAKAIELEVAGMAALGDEPDDVKEEFKPFNDKSLFFIAMPHDSEGNAEDIDCMGRMIAHSDEGNKTLTDLAHIPGWDSDGITTAEHTTPAGNKVVAHDEKDVIRKFQAESGNTSLEKVWDISTLAPKLGIYEEKGVKPGKVSKAVINAFTAEVVKAWSQGDITHLTSFNHPHAHTYFKNLGFPFKNMFGLGPMSYDSFDSDDNMVAEPAWMSVDEMVEAINARETSYFQELDMPKIEAPSNKADKAKGVSSLAVKSAAFYAWSILDYRLLIGGGVALEQGGMNGWLAGGLVTAATTGQTFGMSYLATMGKGSFELPDGKLAELAKKSPMAATLWYGAPIGLLIDKTLGNKVTLKKRLAHSGAYGAAMGTWVAPTPLREAVEGVATPVYKEAKQEVTGHPVETAGIASAALLALAASRIAKKRR